ncbi:lipopolysaccharide biosynthesis protein [Gorillibacterium sp. sgz5001074]|uniref:lipopolysaccharide biosynthesis protein n=1 Tax=Gorillibacterium sp. sgz5001074 TaxID=3446695 RepID=UPI003F66A877
MIKQIKDFFGNKGIVATILLTSFTNVSVLLLTTLISILTARMLGVEGRGELSAILFWPTFLAGLIGLGLPTSLIYHVKREGQTAQYFRYAAGTLLPLGVLAGVIAWFFLPVWLDKYSDTVISLARVYTILMIPMILLLSLLGALAKSTENFQVNNGIVVLVPLLNSIGLVMLWQFDAVHLSVIIVVYLLSQLAIASFGIIRLKNFLARNVHQMKDRITKKPYFSYGMKVYGMDLIGTLYNQADKIIIVSLLTPRDFGLYSVVYALSRIFNTVQLAITDVLFPKVTGLKPEVIIKTVARAFRISLVIMSLVLIPSLFIGKLMLGWLFGHEFLEASSTFYLLSIECVLGGSSWILASSFNSIGRPELVLIRQIIAILINVTLFFVFVPLYGLNGIALALLSGSIVRLIITLVQMPYVFKVTLRSILYDKEDLMYFKKIISTITVKVRGAKHEDFKRSSSHG